MKKLLLGSLVFFVVSMAACMGADGDTSRSVSGQTAVDGSDTTSTGGSRYLVIYASRSGNTERVARQIRTMLGCDILEIEPAAPYNDNYDAMLARAREELASIRQGNYPQAGTVETDFDRYDMVFIGYPIWYGSMATPMQGFLHEYASKLAGKRIALFATSGSSGISTSVGEAERLCPDADVLGATLLLTSATLPHMSSRVGKWLERLGIDRDGNGSEESAQLKVRITAGGCSVTATMEDNAAGRDFMSRLPMEVTLSDYNNAEKIFYPAPVLSVEGVERGCAPIPGDIAIYAPWGNVAVFYKSWSHSNDLIKIGHIDGDGIGVLSVEGSVGVKFEKL